MAPDAAPWDEPAPAGYRRNSRGDLVREANVTEINRRMDAVVRRIHAAGQSLSEQLWRFRMAALAEIWEFRDWVVESNGGRIGGRKGNITLTSYDGRERVQLAQAERVEAGIEILAAQAILEECVDAWSKGSGLNLQALVDQAFKRDAMGCLSVSHLLRLRRVEIDHPRWRDLQRTIADALRPVGVAEYVRLHRRPTPEQPWEQVPLHLAKVRPPEVSDNDSGPEAALRRRVRSAVEEARLAGMKEGEIMEALRAAKRRVN